MIVWNIIWWALIILGAIYGTVCMALSLILRNGGRSAIERRLSARGRDQAWRDMDAHRHQTAHVFALEAWIIAIAWLVLWTIDFSGLPGADFSTTGFFIGLGIGSVLCWLSLDLVATAIARHAGPAPVSNATHFNVPPAFEAHALPSRNATRACVALKTLRR